VSVKDDVEDAKRALAQKFKHDPDREVMHYDYDVLIECYILGKRVSEECSYRPFDESVKLVLSEDWEID
jgi:hypothetical protein